MCIYQLRIHAHIHYGRFQLSHTNTYTIHAHGTCANTNVIGTRGFKSDTIPFLVGCFSASLAFDYNICVCI